MEGEYDNNIRDLKLLEGMSQFSQKVNQTFVENQTTENATKDLSIVFLLLPQWDPSYPPYNLARLSGITEAAGYKTTVFDINIASFVDSRSWLNELDFDPWNANYMVKWFGQEYYNHLHEKLKPILEKYIEKVVELNPTIIGFTLYDANRETVLYINKEIRKRLPNVISIIGGPICHRANPRIDNNFEYIVEGEAEKLILDIFKDIETNGRPAETKKLIQQLGERASLDFLPAPNWRYFDFNQYRVPNGATLEFSRGCIAKCVFCDETHFWKYRGRDAGRVLEEIKTLYAMGVNNFWFVDSLINGNLKELRNFCNMVIQEDLSIHWCGYARCDERMDLDYFKDLRKAGCWGLSFGVESGSDKVLKDMNKAITSEEVYQNFIHGAEVGLRSGIMLLVGFPTESYIDFYKTMELVWRIRNCNLNFIGGGYTMQVTPDSIIGQDRPSFNVLEGMYGLNWITANFDNSKLHRLIRLKSTFIFLEHLVNKYNKNYNDRANIKNHYTIKFENEQTVNELTPETFDFNIIQTNTGNNLADTILNEVWPLFRILYRARGAYEVTLNFDSALDSREFSYQLTSPFDATFYFKINNDGEWTADFKAVYQQPEGYWHFEPTIADQSNAMQRIKKFVKNKSEKIDVDGLRNKYQNLDLSFNISYNGTGKW